MPHDLRKVRKHRGSRAYGWGRSGIEDLEVEEVSGRLDVISINKQTSSDTSLIITENRVSNVLGR